MNYKIGILGATGRIGQEMAALMSTGFVIGGDTLEFCDAVAGSKKITSVDGVSVRLLSEPMREPVHAWIDFSRPEATLRLLEAIAHPIVIGTTGFDEKGLAAIRQYAKKHPVLLTSNTSPGLNLMLKMLNEIPEAASLGYDVLASEIHHRKKVDAPSGTLKTLMHELEKQGHRNMQVNYARLGDEKGTHTISFVSPDEELTITHRVNNRRVFGHGALLAAHFIVKIKEPGLYSFQDIASLGGLS